MKNAVRRAGFRPLTCGRWHILLRPAALPLLGACIFLSHSPCLWLPLSH